MMKILHAIDCAQISKTAILDFAKTLQDVHDTWKEECPVHRELEILLKKMTNSALDSSFELSHHVSHLKTAHLRELVRTLIRLGYSVEQVLSPDQDRVYIRISWERWA